MRCSIALVFLMFFMSSSFALSNMLQVTSTNNNRITRITFKLSKKTSYNYFALQHPARVVVNFHAASMRTPIGHLLDNNSQITKVRYHENKEHNLRMVFNTPNLLSMHFSCSNDNKTVYLDIVHNKIIKKNPTRDVVAAKIKPKTKVDFIVNKKTKVIKQAIKQHNLNLADKMHEVVIVIDPGHGGKDPGAIGLHHAKEKNIVLAISRYLAADLNAQRGINAVLTRDSDRYISLRGRLHFARKNHANVFVAIHADAYRKKDARGMSVYALSKSGATSEAARWLAQSENISELMGGANLRYKSYMLRSVLLDLSLTATINSSLTLGRIVLNSLGRIGHEHHSKVEQARFVVLKSPDIPSILVETGFLSNRYEELNLCNSVYQRKVAQTIASGIINYLKLYPPYVAKK